MDTVQSPEEESLLVYCCVDPDASLKKRFVKIYQAKSGNRTVKTVKLDELIHTFNLIAQGPEIAAIGFIFQDKQGNQITASKMTVKSAVCFELLEKYRDFECILTFPHCIQGRHLFMNKAKQFLYYSVKEHIKFDVTKMENVVVKENNCVTQLDEEHFVSTRHSHSQLALYAELEIFHCENAEKKLLTHVIHIDDRLDYILLKLDRLQHNPLSDKPTIEFPYLGMTYIMQGYCGIAEECESNQVLNHVAGSVMSTIIDKKKYLYGTSGGRPGFSGAGLFHLGTLIGICIQSAPPEALCGPKPLDLSTSLAELAVIANRPSVLRFLPATSLIDDFKIEDADEKWAQYSDEKKKLLQRDKDEIRDFLEKEFGYGTQEALNKDVDIFFDKGLRMENVLQQSTNALNLLLSSLNLSDTPAERASLVLALQKYIVRECDSEKGKAKTLARIQTPKRRSVESKYSPSILYF